MIIGYARVSTAGQKLDCQIEQLNAFGCEKIYQEKESGANDDRRELARLLSGIKDGDIVVVTKLDRIARSTQHLLTVVDTLAKKGAAFKTLNADIDTSTPTGKLMLTLLGAIATFEREIMLERQRDGIEKAKSEGKYKGRAACPVETSNKIMELIGEGVSRSQVAVKAGVSIATVYRIQRNRRGNNENKPST